MAEQYNPSKRTHRIRTRLAAAHGVEWELLQTFLGFAFTVQQEAVRAKLLEPAASDSLAEGLHPALERIAACARNLTDATGAAMALGGPDAMVCVARSGATAPPIGARFDATAGLSGECIRTGESAICVNAAADPRVNYQACRALHIASMLYFPLRSKQGKMIGMLGVFSSKTLHFSQRDIPCLRLIEGLVQEAIGRKVSDPDPATLRALLRQADFAAIEDQAANFSPPRAHEGERAPTSAPVPPTQAAPSKTSNGPLSRPSPPTPLQPKSPQVVTRAVLQQPAVAQHPKPEPVFVGCVVDEAVQEDADISIDPELEDEEVHHRNYAPAIVAFAVALAIVFSAWHYNFLGTERVPNPRPQAATTTDNTTASSLPATKEHESGPPERALTAAVSLRSGESDASVTILLPKAIRFEGYQLSHPDRIYFDLHDIKLTDAKGNVFKSDEGLISRVRLSNYGAGITRVVFDLREPATFDAKLADKPQRLIIQLRKTAPASKRSQNDSGVPTKVTIVVDPGHGGKDLGTVSPSGLQEKDLTLDVAQRLGALLKERLDANVIFTRDNDEYITLDQRAAIANAAHADFMISIHGNSSTLQSVRGIETYYYREPQSVSSQDETKAAQAFAADVHRALVSGLTDPRQPMRDRGVKEASFVVLREAQMPAALAEISFISNSKDEPRLESPEYRQRIASALFKGIAGYVKSRHKSKTTTSVAAALVPGQM